MTMMTHTTTPISSPISAPARVFSRFFAALAAQAERRHAYRTLHALSDRDLADIGLTRTDLNAMR